MSDKVEEFRKELAGLLNRYNQENGSNTSDWILANYLEGCLNVFDEAVLQRERWYGRDAIPGAPAFAGGDATRVSIDWTALLVQDRKEGPIAFVEPPCRFCKHWAPVYQRSVDVLDEGVKCCRAKDMFQDFSCYEAR
jgi:hypothetical protein